MADEKGRARPKERGALGCRWSSGGVGADAKGTATAGAAPGPSTSTTVCCSRVMKTLACVRFRLERFTRDSGGSRIPHQPSVKADAAKSALTVAQFDYKRPAGNSRERECDGEYGRRDDDDLEFASGCGFGIEDLCLERSYPGRIAPHVAAVFEKLSCFCQKCESLCDSGESCVGQVIALHTERLERTAMVSQVIVSWSLKALRRTMVMPKKMTNAAMRLPLCIHTQALEVDFRKRLSFRSDMHALRLECVTASPPMNSGVHACMLRIIRLCRVPFR